MTTAADKKRRFGAVSDILQSEKGLFVGLLVVAATTLVFTDYIQVEDWMDYTKFLAVTYVGGKTIQGIGDNIAKRGKKA